MSVIARLDSQVDEVLFGSLNGKRRAEADMTTDAANERQAQPPNHDSGVAATRAPRAVATDETRDAHSSVTIDEPNDLPVWML